MMIAPGIDIRVEVADALSRRCRLLIVKHAQYSYGVDAKIVASLRVPPGLLPAPGSSFRVDTNGRIAPSSVIFIGVPGISNFAYREIREFGRRAIAAASEDAGDVREICLTLHGPGFGLDEIESFESEVAGIVDAVKSGQVSPKLETVTFLEMDRQRSDRMKLTLATLLKNHGSGPAWIERTGERLAESYRLRTVGYDSSARSHAFVAMPFDAAFEDIFYYGIAPSIRAGGLLCERMDKLAFTGDVMQRLRERIIKAECLVADVSGANPNVYLEVGFAWGREVPAILLCNNRSELKFDVRGQRCLVYNSIRDLEDQLSREIKEMFPGRERFDRLT
jgi:hypothetical protein